ncbi:hypothetical protein J6590_093374 [Homalodisca vitripennis]|nr:hypothetical protein J6590_093374 [Homalodisca vitripennis]
MNQSLQWYEERRSPRRQASNCSFAHVTHRYSSQYSYAFVPVAVRYEERRSPRRQASNCSFAHVTHRYSSQYSYAFVPVAVKLS